jgi:hypothetical protein
MEMAHQLGRRHLLTDFGGVAAGIDVESLLTVNNAADTAAKRARLIRYIRKRRGFPNRLPRHPRPAHHLAVRAVGDLRRPGSQPR